MTREELLKFVADMPIGTWVDFPYDKFDKGARESVLLNNPTQQFQDHHHQPATDRQMLKDGVDYIAAQLSIVLVKRGKEPAKLKGSFKNRVDLAHGLRQ